MTKNATNRGELYTATIGIDEDKYTMSFGHDMEWTDPLSMDFSQPPFQAFVINGLDPTSPESSLIVEQIKQMMSESKKGLKVLIDLGTGYNESVTSSQESYNLLFPLISKMPFQAVPRSYHEFPLLSPYLIGLKSADLLFPLLDTFDSSNQIYVLAMESFLDLSQESISKFHIVFQPEYFSVLNS